MGGGIHFFAQAFGDLRHDGDRDFGRRDRADVEADRRVDAGQIGVADALPAKPFEAARMRLPRSERADIEAVARQRVGERGIVDLRVVGERNEGGVTIDIERRQRLVRPFGDDFDIRKALGRGKGGARIDDGHVIAKEPSDRRQRLADMDRAGDDKLRRRHMDGEKHAAFGGLFHAAFAGAQVLGKVVQVTEGHRFGSPATIRIRPDVVVLPDGSRYVLRAQVLATSTKSRIDDEGTLKPASRIKSNVIKETAGMGAGAITGAIIGGGPGALVGTLIGAGVMTTHILVQTPASVNVPKDSTLTLSLTQPMSITPVVAANN